MLQDFSFLNQISLFSSVVHTTAIFKTAFLAEVLYTPAGRVYDPKLN